MSCKTVFWEGIRRASSAPLKAALRDDYKHHILSAGTEGKVLVQGWNGRTYRVEVMPDGYLLNGKSYRSLAAVAHHITGAK
ncbi:MAG: DUF2924 domain-containing protein [Pseudomonadota bacterium]